MSEENANPPSPYAKGFNVSLIAHIGVLLVLCVTSFVNGCAFLRNRKKKTEIPIEFTVAIPEEYVGEECPKPEPVKDEPVVKDDPIPVPVPDKPIEKKKPEEPPKPPKKKIEKTTKIIERKEPPKKKEIVKLPPNIKTVKVTGPKLTPEEIRKMLERGATPSDRTSIPGDEAICLLAIKNTLYQAWRMPSAENKTRIPAEIEITLGSTGAVLGYRLTRSSGNRVLDNSALDAAAAVPRFGSLSPEFLRSHRKVTIDFELE
jgi:TonB family protein